MKHFLIFLSLMAVGAMAYIDAKDRLVELDGIAKASNRNEQQNLNPEKK